MAKFSSYIKSLIPSVKAIRRLPHYQNLLPISPKDQYDMSGLVVPHTGSNNWNNNIDIEYLQKMYDCHDLVHSCIDLVSSTFALAKLKVKKYDIKTQNYNYVPDHPLQTLLNNPNSTMGGYDLRQSYIVHRLLFGTMAALLIRGNMTISNNEANRCPMCHRHELENEEQCPHILWHFNTGPVTQILPVHLDRLNQEEVETKAGKRTFFVYDFGDGVKRLIHPDNILTDPNYNPGGSFYGTSPTAEIKRWLEIDLGLSKQIGAYLLNNAIPSMILNLKPPKWSEGQSGKMEDPSGLLEKMKEKWMKDFSMNGNNSDYSYGGVNEHKVKTPAFVYGDLEILKVQDGIKDIVQKPLFYEIENRIAMAYKVPRSFFEFGIVNSVNGQSQNEDFFNYGIKPQLDSFKAKIERYILPSYNDPTLELEWDLTGMGIASFLIDKQEAKTLKRWELGSITLDELRHELQLNPFHNAEEGSQRYRTSVMSDGSGNTQVNQSNITPIDNRFQNDPQVDRQANGLLKD